MLCQTGSYRPGLQTSRASFGKTRTVTLHGMIPRKVPFPRSFHKITENAIPEVKNTSAVLNYLLYTKMTLSHGDMTLNKLDVTIGICAYNEEQNIERSIRSIYDQNTRDITIKEIIVVSSGSTDGTDAIVEKLAKEYDNITLIKQKKREGKNSAINCYLDSKTCNIVVMLNADNIFGNENSLYNLVSPFHDDKIGMVGGHPIPTNDMKDKVGFSTHVLWTMHHHLALIYPKIGELVAFRDIGTRLPLDQQSDEDIIRMNLENAGYECVYAEDAIVLNRGPETRDDFLKQRIRVNIGEVNMKQKFDYDIPSWNKKYLLKAVRGTVKDLGFHPFKFLYALRLEMKARRIAEKHIKTGKSDMNIWDQVTTTKKL